MGAVLKGMLVVGPCVVLKFQGPKGNEVVFLWLAINGLIVILGGMEDEVLDPNGGISVV